MRTIFSCTLVFFSFLTPGIHVSAQQPLTTEPAWTAEGDQADASFGMSVATAGDVNGDGYSDVIVGASYYDNGEAEEGRAYVYLGSPDGLSTVEAWVAESDQESTLFGYSVATAGDVNGDGYSDVIVGARSYENGNINEGGAFVYLGSADGLSEVAAWTAEGNQTGARFGESVATAGDVNGDGYSDVIVGARWYDNGYTNEGRAYVYLGSADGLSEVELWTAEGDQANAYFGFSVATAGDVNGDGYSDVIIGARQYDNGEMDEGRAYVYLGSALGLARRPAWTAESDQASALFGNSVATAGDVNGDGYSDVIVGAPYYENDVGWGQGRAYIYLGSADGLSEVPAWTAESDQEGSFFGRSVATAGDVNGDGYSDVIVGAENYSNDETEEGRAYVYLGSADGLSEVAAWTAESDQVEATFGCSVATAGDVNGNGYSDVIVGAYDYTNGETEEGRAYVYHGVCGYFRDHSAYGRLLFSPLCTRDASDLTEDVYDSRSLGVGKSLYDGFYLSSDGMTFAPLVVDDAVHCDGQNSGLGPYEHQPGVPPYLIDHPIEHNFVPLPAHDISDLISDGHGEVLFELLDTQREIYGNTAVYLVRDCGIYLEKGENVTINWISHDVEVEGFQSNLDVVSGSISELLEDGDFSHVCSLGSFIDTTQAVDDRPDPSPGDGYYYLVAGTCAKPIGFGDSSLVPDPRDVLPVTYPCP
jgi:hypothetical protein